jgi:integrase
VSRVGHWRWRRPGVAELRLYIGRDPLSGKKRYETGTVHASTDRDAELALAKFVTDLNGAGVSTSGTFGELLERYYAKRAPDLTPGGAKEMRRRLDTYLVPLRPQRLEVLAGRTGTQIIDEFYVALRGRGGRCRKRKDACPVDSYPCEHGGGGELAAATVERIHHDVRAAFDQGVRWGWVTRNPAELAEAGDVDERDVDPPTTAQVMRFFELAEADDPEFVVFLVVGAVSGQRRGALCALWWENLDLDAGVVEFSHVISLGANGPERIRKGKGKSNRKGKRLRVAIDPGTVAVLRAHRARCDERARLAGLELEPTGYVFSSDGVGHRGWHPSSVSRRFRHLRDAAHAPETIFHDLRAFVVTELLGAGFGPPTIAGRTGHSRRSAATMIGVYGHPREEADRRAAELLGRMLELSPGPEPDDDLAATAEVIPLHR